MAQTTAVSAAATPSRKTSPRPHEAELRVVVSHGRAESRGRTSSADSNARRHAPSFRMTRRRSLNRHLLNDFSFALLSPGLGKKQVNDPEMRDEIRRSFDVKKAQEDIIQARVNGVELANERAREHGNGSRRDLRITIDRGLGSPVFGPSTGTPWARSRNVGSNGRLSVRQHDVRQLASPYQVPAGLRTAPLSTYRFGRPDSSGRRSKSPIQSQGSTTPAQSSLHTPANGENGRNLPSITDLQLPTPGRSSKSFEVTGSAALDSTKTTFAPSITLATPRSAMPLGGTQPNSPIPLATSPRVSTADPIKPRSHATSSIRSTRLEDHIAALGTHPNRQSSAATANDPAVSKEGQPPLIVAPPRHKSQEPDVHATSDDNATKSRLQVGHHHVQPRRHTITAPPILLHPASAALGTKSPQDGGHRTVDSRPRQLNTIDDDDDDDIEIDSDSSRHHGHRETSGDRHVRESSTTIRLCSSGSGSGSGADDSNLDILSRVARLRQQRESYLRACAEAFDAFHGI